MEAVAYMDEFGGRAEDHRAGVVAAASVQAMGAKIDGRPPRPSDFFPRLAGKRRESAPQSAEEMAAAMRHIATATGGGVRKADA